MAEPTPESRLRVDLARRVVAALSGRIPPRASLLVGSSAQGTSDEHSDIDLINYYDQLPDPSAFDAVLEGLGAVRAAAMATHTRDGYSSSYHLARIELQTGATLISAHERRLERIESGDVDWVSAKVVTGLLEGLPLHGEALARGWQERVRSYPEALRRREVEANLGIFPIWLLDEHLAARDARLFRRQMLLDGAFRLLAILSAVNRVYFTSFQFKRSRDHARRLALAPRSLAERLDLVADAPPEEAAEVLRALGEETLAIVAREMPDVDVEQRWRPRP